MEEETRHRLEAFRDDEVLDTLPERRPHHDLVAQYVADVKYLLGELEKARCRTRLDSDTFIAMVRRGEAKPEDIDDFVEQWHKEPGERDLHEAIGLDTEEYGQWVVNPDCFPELIKKAKS